MNCNDFFFFWVFACLSGSTLPNVFVGKAFLERKGMFTRRSGKLRHRTETKSLWWFLRVLRGSA